MVKLVVIGGSWSWLVVVKLVKVFNSILMLTLT
jgi:hypothetical protein